ncbi:alpha/beta fold hydrolase, partial [Streptomyces aureocirculatus]
RASMAGALGYHCTDPDRGARLCFHLKPGSYDTAGLIEVLEQVKVFYHGEQVVLTWDGLSAHWSRAMRAWVAEQDWLTLERLLCLLEAPGRGNLQALPLIDDCDRLVDYFSTAIAPLLDRPFGFFGHSMGALIAYQLTRRLLRQGEPLPTWLGVSAYAAPQGKAGADSRPHLMADDELRAWLRSGGGSPPQLLDNDDVWHKFAPMFRSDFKLVDTWTPPRSPEPLPVPLSVFAGVHDKLIDEDRLLAWRAFTTRFRGLERFDGDHFYLTTQQQPLAAAITAAMRSAAP